MQTNVTNKMELQVFISKKGTKVVSATNLHLALQLPDHHYAANIRKWLNDVYEFKDGIRSPVIMQDFAKRKVKDNPIMKDYYLTVELAKLITLNSGSKVKQKYAKWLFSLEDQVENAELLTKDQVMAVLELTKAMGLVSCQEAAERQRLKTYEERNQGSASNWWRHRSQILGYSAERLRDKMKRLGKAITGKSQRQMLMQLDKYEMIRAGVIDLFMAMGKSERYARNLGDLAKIFAKELKVDIFDDRNAGVFSPNADPRVINDLKAFQKGGFLGLW
jgi:phage anti-repressor protein